MPVTYMMVAVVEFQHTFEDHELEHVGLEDVEPTDTALEGLVIRLENVLRPAFNPKSVELEVNVDSSSDDDDAVGDLNWT